MNRFSLKTHPAPSEALDIESIEAPLLLEAIYQCWGYDFHNYSPVSLKRRIRQIVETEGVTSISALQERLLREPACMQRFLGQATVDVTSMFRDPGFYRAFRALAPPVLKQWPRLRIWQAGCASGEEVYSLAILLHEEGLLEHAQIYATDLHQPSLDAAKMAIYPLTKINEYSENYQAAGGRADFSRYYREVNGTLKIQAELSKNIVWAQHNLATDASFNEFHLIFCRNVLIYFNAHLQQRVHRLIFESLAKEGLLALGRHENLQLTPLHQAFEPWTSTIKSTRGYVDGSIIIDSARE